MLPVPGNQIVGLNAHNPSFSSHIMYAWNRVGLVKKGISRRSKTIAVAEARLVKIKALQTKTDRKSKPVYETQL